MNCKNCGVEIEDGFLCDACQEVYEAVKQLDEKFANQEGR